MDIAKLVRLHQIVGANHAAVGNQLLRPALRFAQVGRLPVAVLEGSDLDVIERQVVLRPQSAPQRYHIGQPRGVIHVASDVRFALIPEESTDGIARHGTEHGIIHDHRTQVLRDAGDSLFGQVDVRITTQHFAAHPAFDAASAPRAVDDADRNAEHVVEHFGEEVTRSGEFRRSSGRAGGPASGRPVLRRIGGGMRNLHIMEFSAFGARAGDDLVRIRNRTLPEAAERHLHIALPSGEPHFADQHTVERHAVAAGEGNPLRLVTSGRRPDRYDPAAFGVTFHGGSGAPRGLDFHRGIRLGPAPQPDLGILLKHHVVADDFGQPDFSRGAPSGRKGDKKQEDSFHNGSVSNFRKNTIFRRMKNSGKRKISPQLI